MIKITFKIKLAAVLSALLLAFCGCAGPVHPEGMPTDTNLGKPALEEYPDEQTYASETRISFVGVGDNIIHEAVFTDAANRATA